MVFLLSPQAPSLYSQISKQGVLVKSKSDHASSLFKTLQWHPISLVAKANLVTSTKFASLFFSPIVPIFTPSAPATLILTHQLPQGHCSGCFLCLEFFSPKCQQFALLVPSTIYLLKCYFLSKPLPGTLSKISPTPYILSPLHFSP